MERKSDADFSKLLRESMGLVSHIDTQGVPAIQRNLNQLDALSRKIAAKTQPKTDTYTDAQAYAARFAWLFARKQTRWCFAL